MPTIYSNNHPVGFINDGETVFRKRVYKSKHLLRVLDAWCLGTDSLDAAVEHGADTVEIFDAEENMVYTVPIAHFYDAARYTVVNYGHGEQRALPRSEWNARTAE